MTVSPEDNLMVDDDELLEVSQSQLAVSVVCVGAPFDFSDLLAQYTDLRIEVPESLDHWDFRKGDVYLVVAGKDKLEFDIGLINRVRQNRPLAPLLVRSTASLPQEIYYKAGAHDVLCGAVEPGVLGHKIAALHLLGRSAKLIELQNEELLRTMDDLRKEIIERQKAQKKLKQAQELLIATVKAALRGEDS